MARLGYPGAGHPVGEFRPAWVLRALPAGGIAILAALAGAGAAEKAVEEKREEKREERKAATKAAREEAAKKAAERKAAREKEGKREKKEASPRPPRDGKEPPPPAEEPVPSEVEEPAPSPVEEPAPVEGPAPVGEEPPAEEAPAPEEPAEEVPAEEPAAEEPAPSEVEGPAPVASPPPVGSLRARLRSAPELVLSVDMEPATLDGDMLGAPVEAALSPDGRFLAVGGKFKVIRFFDGKTGKFLCRRPDPRPPLGAQRTLVWVDNRYCIAIGSEHAAFVWDAQSDFRCVKAFRKTIFEALQVIFHPKRRLVAVAQTAGVVSVWNFDQPATGDERGLMGFGDRSVSPEVMAHCIFVPKGSQGASRVEGIAFSPDGMRIAAASQFGLDVLDASGRGPAIPTGNRTIMHAGFWDNSLMKGAAPIRDMPLLKRIPVPESDAPEEPTAYRADWSADDRFIAVGYGLNRNDSHKKENAGHPARIRLFDPKTLTQIREWTAHTVRVYALNFSPDGSVLASGGQRKVVLWDPATGAQIMALPDHGDEVTSTRWSADGKLLVTCAGSERHDSPSHRNGRDGGFLAPGKDRLVRIWRVAD